MTQSNTTYGYYRVCKNEFDNIGYVCIRLDRPAKESRGIGIYKASFSFCSPDDGKHFTKHLARKIADARMNTKRVKSYIEFDNQQECPKLVDMLNKALKKGIEDDLMPLWFDEGAIKPGLKDLE